MDKIGPFGRRVASIFFNPKHDTNQEYGLDGSQHSQHSQSSAFYEEDHIGGNPQKNKKPKKSKNPKKSIRQKNFKPRN